ncbi:MAG: hypothetical protein GEV13_13610 [Rhodospirillales bacterium]|nr:hypothetical protein [Rhodospirillales bacterium]
MSRSPFAHRRAANQADFAGPDADREAIERLARSARLANEQRGGGRVADEVLQRNTLLIEAAQAELDELLGEVAKLRGVLGNRKKVAKNDGCDVDAIVQALRLKKQAGTGGSEPIVTRHRMVGRILGLLGHPLGTQFKLFGNDEREALGGDEAEAAEGARH